MSENMLQAVINKPGKVEFEEVKKPKPKDNEVLIKIKRIGICGSDIHVFNGHHPFTSYPVVQGHEVSGIIEGTGKFVSDFSVGDRVTFMPQITCNKCYPCKNGMYHICDFLKVMGFQTTGAAQEYIVIHKDKVIKLPESLSFEEGAMIEPISVAVHALRRGGNVHGKKILVLGAGTIGNLVGQVAKGFGASEIMITELSDYRLDIAKQCGIDFAINSGKENLSEAILDNFGPEKADIILECVGVGTTISQAISLARKGTTIVVVGVFAEKPVIDLGLVQDRELSLVGTLMYQKEDYIKAIELAESGKLSLKKLISKSFPFLNYLDAYQYIGDKKDYAMKVMITFD
jgi:L-iditol 2-dehydrogenase